MSHTAPPRLWVAHIDQYCLLTADTTFIDGPNVTADCPMPDNLPSYQPGPYCPSFTYDPSYAAGYIPNPFLILFITTFGSIVAAHNYFDCLNILHSKLSLTALQLLWTPIHRNLFHYLTFCHSATRPLVLICS